ncbi:MAG: hypothetical protein ACKVTZ_03945 [Bacteroidia bacterium]
MRFYFVIFLLLFCATFSLKAQYMDGAPPEVPALMLTGIEENATHVVIAYEITHPGYVELHLYNEKKKRVWIKGKVDEKPGKGALKIPVEPLKPNEKYEYLLKYKGTDNKGFFYSVKK